MSDLLPKFEGTAWRLANNWFGHVPREDRPINYLEIGTLCGANLISVANSYGAHPESKLYCIDPWEEYAEYPEGTYDGEQESNYRKFLKNIVNNNILHKTVILRDYSNRAVPRLADDFYDIIYIDGNHEPEYVLEDGVLCFRKLKVGGYMIFDDYGFGGPDLTKRGIDGFLSGYHKRIRLLALNQDCQTIIQKIR